MLAGVSKFLVLPVPSANGAVLDESIQAWPPLHFSSRPKRGVHEAIGRAMFDESVRARRLAASRNRRGQSRRALRCRQRCRTAIHTLVMWSVRGTPLLTVKHGVYGITPCDTSEALLHTGQASTGTRVALAMLRRSSRTFHTLFHTRTDGRTDPMDVPDGSPWTSHRHHCADADTLLHQMSTRAAAIAEPPLTFSGIATKTKARRPLSRNSWPTHGMSRDLANRDRCREA